MIPGFKFCPSDKVLLSYYLLKRLKGEPTEFQIPEIDVYGIEPWRLFSEINGSDDDVDDDNEEDEPTCSNNLKYLFTNIKKKHEQGERIDRTVTSSFSSSQNRVIGTWKGQTSQTHIKVSNEIVGVKKMLSFMAAPSKQDECNGGNSKKRKRKISSTNNIEQLDGITYIMHEYSIPESCYVLCRIRRKIDKKKIKKMKYSSSSCSNINTMKYDQEIKERMPYDDVHQMMDAVVLDHGESLIKQQQQQPVQPEEVLDHSESLMKQQPVQPEEGDMGGFPILINGDDDDVDDANMSTFVQGSTVSSSFAQDLEDMLCEGSMVPSSFAQDLEDMLCEESMVPSPYAQHSEDILQDTNTTSTTGICNGDEDNITGVGHEEVEEEEEDLSSQQQLSPAPTPTPTSKEEGNLSILSSLTFEPSDYPDFNNVIFPSSYQFDEPILNFELWT